MTGSRRNAGGRSGGHALDVPVAALAGLSVAFLVYVAPAELLAELVGATGLPSLIPAAAPPLGFTARALLGVAGAFAAFSLALLVLRWLGRFGRVAEQEELELVEEVEAPRVRRRDFHPDAPPRPPILAAAELGEPVLHAVEEIEPDPVAEHEPAFEPEPLPQPEPESLAEPEPGPLAGSEPFRHAWLAPAPAPSQSVREETPTPSFGSSIPELMERLERGLAARRGRSPAPAAPDRADPPVFPEVADARLQSAIDSLQRLAARQH